MTNLLTAVHDMVWGLPALVLILGVGIWLTITTRAVQFRQFPRALGLFWRRLSGREATGEGVSSFQALCTALAATVGTGNIVGVAGAICLGGPGAVFWMWLCAFLGMATKYAEVALAVRFRRREKGEYLGGPMYIMDALGGRWKGMANLYSLFGVVAAFGVGNATQINAVVSGIGGLLGGISFRQTLGLGLLLAVLVGSMLLGGARRIGAAAELLVPFASAAYILLCLVVLFLRREALPEALKAILQGALSPRAVTGGILGSVWQALRIGCARGVFTNEAGMGTAAIAHASAEGAHPAEQGLMGVMEVFLDTILICTLTALAILVSGVPIPYGIDAGGQLTADAFSLVCGGWVRIFLTGALCCFAIATVLGWGLYGGRCAQYLFGSGAWKGFALAQTAMVVFGAVVKTETVWLLAETVNGLMAIPNLLTLAAGSSELSRLTREYQKGKTL